jgi:tetratricopeptide (TPR) repeat protein
MAADITKINPELEALFRKYESAPDSYVFAPLADAYRKAGMFEEAVEICRKGVRRHPGYPSGHVVEGKCHFDIGDLDLAEEAFKNVLKLDASNLVALKFLGMIQAGHGDLERAGEYFRHILVLDPENREIKGMLEDIRAVHRYRGEPGKETTAGPADTDGRSVADDVTLSEDRGDDDPWKDEPDDDSFEGSPIHLGKDDGMSDELATTTLADIYAAQGYYDKAGRIYREVLRRQPDNAVIRKKLAELETGGDDGDTVEPALAAEPLQADITVEDRSAIDLDEPEPSREPVRVEESTRRAGIGAAKKAAPAVQHDARSENKMDDKKSYDQFKRWLDNMQK